MSLLNVTVKRAKYVGTQAAQLNTYVTLKLQNVKSTTVTVKGSEPCWEQDFLFETNNVNNGLLVEIWTKGMIWDRALGYLLIQLGSISYKTEESQGKWYPIDMDVILMDGEVAGTQNPTGHMLLLDCRFELPFEDAESNSGDIQRRLELFNNGLITQDRRQRQALYFGNSGYSEDSDYTSDLNYPVGQNANSSASQYRNLRTPQRSLETSRENSYEKDDRSSYYDCYSDITTTNRQIMTSYSPDYYYKEENDPLSYNSRPMSSNNFGNKTNYDPTLLRKRSLERQETMYDDTNYGGGGSEFGCENEDYTNDSDLYQDMDDQYGFYDANSDNLSEDRQWDSGGRGTSMNKILPKVPMKHSGSMIDGMHQRGAALPQPPAPSGNKKLRMLPQPTTNANVSGNFTTVPPPAGTGKSLPATPRMLPQPKMAGGPVTGRKLLPTPMQQSSDSNSQPAQLIRPHTSISTINYNEDYNYAYNSTDSLNQTLTDSASARRKGAALPVLPNTTKAPSIAQTQNSKYLSSSFESDKTLTAAPMQAEKKEFYGSSTTADDYFYDSKATLSALDKTTAARKLTESSINGTANGVPKTTIAKTTTATTYAARTTSTTATTRSSSSLKYMSTEEYIHMVSSKKYMSTEEYIKSKKSDTENFLKSIRTTPSGSLLDDKPTYSRVGSPVKSPVRSPEKDLPQKSYLNYLKTTESATTSTSAMTTDYLSYSFTANTTTDFASSYLPATTTTVSYLNSDYLKSYLTPSTSSFDYLSKYSLTTTTTDSTPDYLKSYLTTTTAPVTTDYLSYLTSKTTFSVAETATTTESAVATTVDTFNVSDYLKKFDMSAYASSLTPITTTEVTSAADILSTPSLDLSYTTDYLTPYSTSDFKISTYSSIVDTTVAATTTTTEAAVTIEAPVTAVTAVTTSDFMSSIYSKYSYLSTTTTAAATTTATLTTTAATTTATSTASLLTTTAATTTTTSSLFSTSDFLSKYSISTTTDYSKYLSTSYSLTTAESTFGLSTTTNTTASSQASSIEADKTLPAVTTAESAIKPFSYLDEYTVDTASLTSYLVPKTSDAETDTYTEPFYSTTTSSTKLETATNDFYGSYLSSVTTTQQPTQPTSTLRDYDSFLSKYDFNLSKTQASTTTTTTATTTDASTGYYKPAVTTQGQTLPPAKVQPQQQPQPKAQIPTPQAAKQAAASAAGKASSMFGSLKVGLKGTVGGVISGAAAAASGVATNTAQAVTTTQSAQTTTGPSLTSTAKSFGFGFASAQTVTTTQQAQTTTGPSLTSTAKSFGFGFASKFIPTLATTTAAAPTTTAPKITTAAPILAVATEAATKPVSTPMLKRMPTTVGSFDYPDSLSASIDTATTTATDNWTTATTTAITLGDYGATTAVTLGDYGTSPAVTLGDYGTSPAVTLGEYGESKLFDDFDSMYNTTPIPSITAITTPSTTTSESVVPVTTAAAKIVDYSDYKFGFDEFSYSENDYIATGDIKDKETFSNNYDYNVVSSVATTTTAPTTTTETSLKPELAITTTAAAIVTTAPQIIPPATTVATQVQPPTPATPAQPKPPPTQPPPQKAKPQPAPPKSGGGLFGSFLGKAAAAVQSASQIASTASAMTTAVVQKVPGATGIVPTTTAPTTTATATATTTATTTPATTAATEDIDNNKKIEKCDSITATTITTTTSTTTTATTKLSDTANQNDYNKNSDGEFYVDEPQPQQQPQQQPQKLLPTPPQSTAGTGKKLPIINGKMSYLMKRQPTEIYEDEEMIEPEELIEPNENDLYYEEQQRLQQSALQGNIYYHDCYYDYRDDYFDEEDEYKYLEIEQDELLQHKKQPPLEYIEESRDDYIDDLPLTTDDKMHLGVVDDKLLKRPQQHANIVDEQQLHQLQQQPQSQSQSQSHHQTIKKQDSIILEEDEEIQVPDITPIPPHTTSTTTAAAAVAGATTTTTSPTSTAVTAAAMPASHVADLLLDDELIAVPKKKTLTRGETEEVTSGLMRKPEITARQRWNWAYNKIIMQLNVSTICILPALWFIRSV